MYSGRQPAMTALVAMASIVATPWRGGTTPTTSSASRPEAAIMRSTSSSVGGTVGKPSVPPLAKYCSMGSMAPRTVSGPLSFGVALPVTMSRSLSQVRAHAQCSTCGTQHRGATLGLRYRLDDIHRDQRGLCTGDDSVSQRMGHNHDR